MRQFILGDVVFSPGDGQPPEPCFERFAGAFPNMRVEAARHVAQEFSTYDWIIEGLLTRAGFEILSKVNRSESFFRYHCRRG